MVEGVTQMARLNIFSFGMPRIEIDGVPVEVNNRKAVALLTFLAATFKTHSRDTLATLLWPDYDQSHARASLRYNLSILKKALSHEWFDVHRETIGLVRSDNLWVDVVEFRSLLASCRTHTHPPAQTCPECVAPLTEAVKLYRDRFLAGFVVEDSVSFDDWQSSQDQSLHSEALSALESLVLWHRDQEEFEKAIEHAHRCLELDRTNERVHRLLMESYAKTGRRTAALRQYEECVRVLKKELNEVPKEETIRLYEAIKENLVETVVSNLSPDAPTNNLPRQLTSFIGRKREIEEVKRLLSTTYLLTLTGAGGCGKTRLALEVATDLIEEYEDGVWLVELAALSAPNLVPQEVASTLGVSEQQDRSLTDTLSDYLRSKKLLLVLDNCEHLIEACATLAEALLHACPNLRILATSREGLRIAGETAWRVPSLSLPDPEQIPSLEAADVRQYEAIDLFRERALAAFPSFALTKENARTVVQICQLLDGIPLAIELAAALVEVLSVDQILSRLDDRFRLLTGGSRTALPRQQTLLATIEWSHDLLSEKERVLLRRLSVFAGGWTLSAAEAVCSDRERGGILSDEVLPLLTRLVNKSLVDVERQDRETRYRLLETVRQYARDKLVESGEAEVLRGRHLEWYLGLAERAEPELFGAEQAIWFDRLDAELDNIRAALEWSLGGGEAEAGLRLAGALWWFWGIRAHVIEGRGWLERALAMSSGARTSARAKALYGAGLLAWGQGDFERAVELCEESRALCREIGDKMGITHSLAILGYVAWGQGDYGHAAALYEEVVALRREIGDKRGIAHSLNLIGSVALHQGDYGRATELSEECLALCRELGDKWGIAIALYYLGGVVLYQGDYGRAVTLCEQSLALFKEMESKLGVAQTLCVLGTATFHQGDNKRGKALLKESLLLCRELGIKVDIVRCLKRLAMVAGAEGQPERAARLLGAAEALRQAIGAPLPPMDRPQYDRSIASVRARLGEEAFAKAWEEGRKMTMEEAVQLAVGSGQ
jgi:non-specific serine/threonine protein kinase